MDSGALTAPETSIGQAVLRAKDEIKQLREKLQQKKGDGKIEVAPVEEALQKTEETLKRRTDEILSDINNRVKASPINAAQPVVKYDAHKQDQGENEGGESDNLPTNPPPFNAAQHESPGENVKANFRTRVMLNPQNPRVREVMNEKYGIQLPQIGTRASYQAERIASVNDATTPRPLKQRKNLEVTAEMVTSEAHRGLLNLLERGLLPRATQLTLEPSPVLHRSAALHDRGEQSAPQTRLTRVAPLAAIEHKPAAVDGDFGRNAHGNKHNPRTGKPEVKTTHVPTQPFAVSSTPALMALEQRAFRFTIQRGRVKENSAEFQTFKNYYVAQWGGIVTVLGYMVKLLMDFSIPLAFVNGDVVARLAEECDDDKPTRDQLLNCLANRRDVEEMMQSPGRRYIAQDGRYAAAVKVQTAWRRFVVRKAYLQYREKKWAAGVIAVSWILFARMTKVRKLLYVKRQKQLENLRVRNGRLAELWSQIKNERHVVIHMPSLGFVKQVRKATEHLSLLESAHFGRLFELANANTDVIYLTCTPVTEEVLNYYKQLTSLRNAVLTGQQKDAESIEDRYRIIVPESVRTFQTHNLSLSSYLKYSPRALRRIRNFIRGRPAFIVPFLPTEEDVYVADLLGVPMLSAEPEVAQLYSTKSGAKRILKAANVLTAPFECDIYSKQQLHESLAQLVTRNMLSIKRYLLKMDNEHHSRGLATVDVSQALPCYSWALKEAERYGENWSQTWAQEQVLLKVLEQMPAVLEQHAKPLNPNIYPTWSKFTEDFIATGGVIEAAAPGRDAVCFSVDCLIEPDGNVSVVGCCDHVHLHGDPYCQAAMSMPQCTIDPDLANDVCFKVAEACKQRKVLGYFCVDFVMFTDPHSGEQVLWTTDVKLSYSEGLANFQLVKFATGGEFVADRHELLVNEPPRLLETQDTADSLAFSTVTKSSSKSSRIRKSRLPERRVRAGRRYAVASSRLFHSNLSVIDYYVLFQICRANGIGFDVTEREGSLFLLKDPFKREFLSMVSICDVFEDAWSAFSKNLRTLNQEAAATTTSARTNFLGIVEDIQRYLSGPTSRSKSKVVTERSVATEPQSAKQ